MIVPGSANPMLLAGGGDPLDELGVIDRSVRNRRSAGAYWSRTFSSAGSLTTWTLRMWLKRADLINALRLFGIGNDTNAVSQHSTSMSSGGELQFFLGDGAGATVGSFSTNGKWRDPAAHYDVHFVWDTTNATASDRMRIYVNGTRQTGTTTNPAINTNGLINAAVLHRLGALSASTSLWFDGQLGQIAFVDGKALEPTAFGQFHPRTGQWRSKTKATIRSAVSVGGGSRNGWGTNGFFLPFDDTTSLTTLGYDRSQSDTDTTGNNWTATNVSLTAGVTYDSMLDTPTNNYATLNPVVPRWTSATCNIENGALRLSTTSGQGAAGGWVLPEGNWYWEINATSVGARCIWGVGTASVIKDSSGVDAIAGQYAHDQAGNLYNNGTETVSWSSSTSNGNVIRIAVRRVGSSLRMWFGNGASWYNSGDPANNTNPAINVTDPSDLYVLMRRTNANTLYFDLNHGQQGFAQSVPSGFKALNTKNLPVNYPVMKGESAFVAVTDTGANIAATLAAAAPWSDWIRIYKRRDSAEGWRWQFSDDSGNYLDSSSTAAKAAFPALSGSSYIGYGLKVSAANGIATGRLTHTSGSADTVTDSLGNARKAIILKNEATGVWYFYHPDLTAGRLLYLEQTTAETIDSTISTVLSNSFVVASALASGTYRWISCAETSGFLKLFSHTGNASTDGPFDFLGFSPALCFEKNKDDGTTNQIVIDSVSSPYNPNGEYLMFNTSSGAVATQLMDMVSSGSKIRNSGTATNASAQKIVGVSIAASPFRYANAR